MYVKLACLWEHNLQALPPRGKLVESLCARCRCELVESLFARCRCVSEVHLDIEPRPLQVLDLHGAM